ncbi:MAG: hypothetical protein EOP58_03435 [Sphingomonadales bacterium]|nr:MAG: hypothetical protein EOP58_03435 [Sphingomonadales bacterium]
MLLRFTPLALVAIALPAAAQEQEKEREPLRTAFRTALHRFRKWRFSAIKGGSYRCVLNDEDN